MESKWFANRGQVLQLSVTLIACVIAAINAWPNMKADQVVSLGPIIFYFLIALVIIILIGLIRSHRAVSTTPSPIALSVPVSEPVAVSNRQIVETPKISTTPDGTSVLSLVAKADIFSFTKHVGEFWTMGGALDIFRLDIVDIHEAEKPLESDYCVEVVILAKMHRILGGDNTKRISTNRFLLPVEPGQFSHESTSLVGAFIGQEVARAVAVWVTHINSHERTVTFKVGRLTTNMHA